MPPINDNWSSATVISATTGFAQGGTNIGSTAQLGEPANSGKTVWYKWTPATYQTVVFSTLYDRRVGDLDQNLKTVLQVFTGSAVTALHEVSYLTGTQTSRYGSWEFGSKVCFDAQPGTTYYIRVDGFGGMEGNFPLSWKDYYISNPGGCQNCPPTYGERVCVGVVQPLVSVSHTYSYGNIPKGKYLILRCAGAFNVGGDESGNPQWTLVLGNVSTGFFQNYSYSYSGASSVQFTGLNAPYPAKQALTETDAVLSAFCMSASFSHTGGDISVSFVDTNTSDNRAGSQLPTFGLYQIVPLLTFNTACVKWTTVGSAATGIFTVLSQNTIDWTGVTATLDEVGGVTGATPVTGVTINKLGGTNISINFTALTSNVTATLRLSHPDWDNDVTLQAYLAPIVTLQALSYVQYAGYQCSGRKVQVYSVALKNTGYWSMNPSVAYDTSGAVAPFSVVGAGGFQSGGCTPITTNSPMSDQLVNGIGFGTPCGAFLGGVHDPNNYGFFYLFLTASGLASPSRLAMTLTDTVSGDLGKIVIFPSIPN